MLASLVVALTLTCGTERWPVKVGADPAAKQVSGVVPVPGQTVDVLRSLEPPTYADDAPRAPEERVVQEVVANLVGFKLEADGDVHAVIADLVTAETVVVEFPSPACLEGSPFSGVASVALEAFTRRFGRATAKFKRFKVPVKVRVVGVTFFDKIHGQTGVAPNGVELHPVLAFEVVR